ncbi:hypothetical protein [Bradyrhizobium sp. cf659]|uniref:hypothetical protein n=1 Tax=Bradyrhizobium sp. cf659 TaxID=1761771 RepID=UPI001160B474|nr:hypothetical protein [Bradyrhizobium sp. cf659]
MLKPILANGTLKALPAGDTRPRGPHRRDIPIWKQIGRRIPLHATLFATEVIKRRLPEASVRSTLKTFRPGDGFNVGTLSPVTRGPVLDHSKPVVCGSLGGRPQFP